MPKTGAWSGAGTGAGAALEKAQARTEVEPEQVHAEPGPMPIGAYPDLIAGVDPELLRVQRMAKVGRLKSWELLGPRRKG